MSADPIRARLDAMERDGFSFGDMRGMHDALRAVLDLADQHALCAVPQCDPQLPCVADDLRDTIADALGVAAPVEAAGGSEYDRGWKAGATAMSRAIAAKRAPGEAAACCDSDDYAGHVCTACGYQHCHCAGGTPGPVEAPAGEAS